jgi:hypothetical protein
MLKSKPTLIDISESSTRADILGAFEAVSDGVEMSLLMWPEAA